MRYFLKLQYLGTHFHGWQSQPNASTVQGEIERGLEIYFKRKVPIMGCGRTDTGVHASIYYAHVDLDIDDIPKFLTKINHIIHDEVVINDVISVEENAHARFDATYRAYTYTIRLEKSPFDRDIKYFYPYSRKPALAKLNECAALLKANTYFEAFAKIGSDVKSFNCQIFECNWKREGDELIFNIAANRFLRGMVRLIVGGCINYALEKISKDELNEALKTGIKPKISWSVPAEGLTLSEVKYPYL